MAPTSTETPGDPLSTKSTILETGAAFVQNLDPVRQICAHLNAFHVYESDPHRFVETNHYCSHLTEGKTRLLGTCAAASYQVDVRQCILYDGPGPGARLIGVEYMITPKLYENLPSEERSLWHSHVFEVKSGMLIMPGPQILPGAWEVAETKEMEDVILLYGKTYHLWQTDRGDALPLGKARADDELHPRGAVRLRETAREGIDVPVIHPDADGGIIARAE
ncbi:DUF1264-domain-containing protein [Mycena sanguinolenta]|uniref:DUF1264-domain-containing protein n=1 Tax=Mycena sanguinolenta TaxID=230812 RepID=A0A8H6XTI0_9AGAR|nr:DUF1264-domain-containing protein [Mycena sanguinolenta]